MKISPTWLRHFSKLTVFFTLFLIFVGALVKSHEVGLSVPDWPTTYGYQMFAFPLTDMVGGIFYEHSHRITATFVGILTIVHALWRVFTEKRKWLRHLGYFALCLIIIQGLFGGITVLFFLPTAISMVHGVMAQTFLLVLILIAYCLSSEYYKESSISKTRNNEMIEKWSVIVFIAIFIQLILGAWMRHINAGLAIPDFPTVGWSWIPLINEDTLQRINDWRFDSDLSIITYFPVWVHLFHRLWAVGVLITVFIFGHYYFKGKKEFNQTMTLLFLGVLFQILLGAFTVWSGKEPIITSFHVLNGALLLGTSFIMVLRYSPILNRLRSRSIET